ncbi:MAG: hypothetical protein ACHQ53_03070 [Polyangiales bacterium]
MEESPSQSKASHIGRELLAGLLGLAIALGCLMPPLIHLVTGPLGPFIGGFVVTKQWKPGARGRAIIAATIGVGLSAIAGTVALVVLTWNDSPPSWFPSSSVLGMIVGGVGLYGAVLGGAGCAVSAAIAGAQSPATADAVHPDPR